jgi:hypothetical protein
MTHMPNDPLGPAMRAALLRLDPRPETLRDWLRPQISDDILDEIAAADYGMDFEAHRSALQKIHTGEPMPAPLPWEPKEVLELIRWSEPSDPNWKPGSVGERGHLMRAFCCAALLEAAADPANDGYFSGENQTIAQLIASALALGEAAQRGALQLLAWRMLDVPRDTGERPFFALGILLLVVALRLDADGALLRELCEWLLAEEAWARAQGEVGPTGDAWLLGVSFFSARDTTWRELGWRVLVEPPHPHPPLAAAALDDIATRLVTGFAE